MRIAKPRHLGSIAFLLLLGFAPKTADAQWVSAPSPSPWVQQHTFQSAAAGETVSYHVMLPPGYAQNPTRRYPSIYWLHGANGVLAGMGSLAQWYRSAMLEGLIPPALVVFPNGMPYGMWTDSKDGAVPMETVVVEELIPEIDAKFRTIPNRSGRILEGFSMGGYGAARIGFAHSERFGAVSMLGSAALQLDFLDTPEGSSIPPEVYLAIYEDVWGSDPKCFLEQGPRARAEAHLADILMGGQRVRIAVGQADHVAPTNLDFQAFLQDLGLPHDFFYPPAIGHQQTALLDHLKTADPNFYSAQFAPLVPGQGAAVVVLGCSRANGLPLVSTGSVAIGSPLQLTLGTAETQPGWCQLYVATQSVQPDACGLLLPGLGEWLLGTAPLFLAQSPLVGGPALFPFAIPSEPAWIGREFALQGVGLFPLGPNLGVELSNGLILRLGQ